jgi:hypothetical protein
VAAGREVAGNTMGSWRRQVKRKPKRKMGGGWAEGRVDGEGRAGGGAMFLSRTSSAAD